MKEFRSFSDEIIVSDRTAPCGSPPAPALAHRRDLMLGGITIRPSLRMVEGANGGVKAEPRVMQVLLVLADAGGAVITQDELLERCWGGAIVGADSIYRAIAEVRRVIRTAGGGCTVETVPKTGFRLTCADGRAPGRREETSLRHEAASLLERGRDALRNEWPDSDAQGAEYLRAATTIDPDNAEAWGLLALAYRNAAENGAPDTVSQAVRASEIAARRALAIDPAEANALTALATLQPYFGDWLAAEDALRNILCAAPDNVAAIAHLVTLLQSAGRTRASWDENERAVALDPLSPVHQFRRALKSWIMGDGPQSDLAIDRALQIWPRHPAVWNARLMLFAFSGRTQAALSMLDDGGARPATMGPPAIALWRTSLRALETGNGWDVAAARTANLDAAAHSPGFALNAVMMLSALGELDAAFAVADGFLLRRGSHIGSLWTSAGQMPVNDQRWRRTMFLYTPPCAAMRADPRFTELCDRIGLTRYWEERGVTPDYRLESAG